MLCSSKRLQFARRTYDILDLYPYSNYGAVLFLQMFSYERHTTDTCLFEDVLFGRLHFNTYIISPACISFPVSAI